jgi:nucleotide-binding universal stress UspA family protein
MDEPRTIVVGVATVEDLDTALAPAIRLADSIGAELHVVHAFEPPDPMVLSDGALLSASPLDASYVSRVIETVVPRLEAQVRRFAEDPSRVVVHALPGVPHARLTGFASEIGADLLVVGATRRGRVWREILGTTAERVLRWSRVPVLVVHQPFLGPVKRVLMTTDLSDLSASVHHRALDVLEMLFSDAPPEVRSLLVVDNRVALATALVTDSIERLGRAAVERFLDARQPGPAVEPVARVGDPCNEIVVEAQAWRADLLVLGTHGRKGISRFVFGSVAAAVLRDANRNVLVIPASAGSDEMVAPVAWEASLEAIPGVG